MVLKTPLRKVDFSGYIYSLSPLYRLAPGLFESGLGSSRRAGGLAEGLQLLRSVSPYHVYIPCACMHVRVRFCDDFHIVVVERDRVAILLASGLCRDMSIQEAK